MREVLYVGFLNEPTGYGEAARRQLVALHERRGHVRGQAVRVTNQGCVREEVADKRYPELEGLEAHPPMDSAIRLIHTPPPHFKELRNSAVMNIGVTVWETDRMPPHWASHLNLADALWVPSQFARRCLEPFFFGPVHVIPHPVRLTSSQARTFPGVPDDMFLFVSVLQWSDRKNPDGLLKAFVRAFRGRRDVGLLLKLGWRVGDANIESAMRTVFLETLGIGRLRAPPVFVVNEEVGRQAMDVLFARADAYVSLHRSEGFGLTLADAMAAEVPVIATGHSGNLDFMDAASAMLVRHRMVPVRQRLVRTWFDGSMTWAEPDLDHAVELMRALVAQPGASATMAANGARRVREQLSPARIGRLMRDHCDG